MGKSCTDVGFSIVVLYLPEGHRLKTEVTDEHQSRIAVSILENEKPIGITP